jgi:hypothetical protein
MNMKTNITSLRPLLAVIISLTINPLTEGAAPTATTVASVIPTVVTEYPAYKSFFKDALVKIHAEGSLSPTRRFLALDGGLMFIVVLDLNRQTNRWEVSFAREVKEASSGDNSRMTIFHRGSKLAVVWQEFKSTTSVKLTYLQTDDQSRAFGVTEYISTPIRYSSFFWEEATGAVLGVRYNEAGVEIGSLDGKNLAVIRLERVIGGPYLLRQYDATTYRLWVTKSEKQLASPNLAAGLGGCLLNCVTLRKTATGYQVVDDKFVANIKYPSSRGGLRGYFDVEDLGKTYKLSMKTFPMSGGLNFDKAIGEFAY